MFLIGRSEGVGSGSLHVKNLHQVVLSLLDPASGSVGLARRNDLATTHEDKA